MNKTSKLLAVGAYGVMLMLAGCGLTSTTNNGGTTTSSGSTLQWSDWTKPDPSLKGQTITVLWDASATTSGAQMTKKLKAEFTKQTGIKVKELAVEYGDVYNKVMTDVMSNSGDIDIAEMDTIWAGQYYKGNVAVDLTNTMPKSVQATFTPSSFTSVEYDGHIMGVPWFSSTKHFYYNKKMFQEAGLNPNQPPKTYDQFLADSKIIQSKLGSKGIYASAWSWKQAESLICDYVGFLGAYDGKFFNADGTPAFNSGGGLKALEMMQTLYKSGTVDPASMQWDEYQVSNAFAAGKIAMMTNWEGEYPQLNDPTQSQVVNQTTVVPLMPGEGSVKSSTSTGSEGIAMLKSSKHKAAALKFLEFIASNQYQLADFQQGGQYPSLQAAYSDPQYLNSDSTHTMKTISAQYHYGMNRPNAPGYVSWSDILNAELHKAIMGQKTAQQALNNAATQIQQAIQQAKN